MYKGNPGLGTRMFWPGLATAEMQRSNEHEHPEHKMTSSELIPSPICSATACLAST